jgi:hypothetical protein
VHLAPPLQVCVPLRALNTGVNDARGINRRLYALLEEGIKNGTCQFSATWFLNVTDAQVSIIHLYLDSLDIRLQMLFADLKRMWPIPVARWPSGRYPPQPNP